MKWVFCNLNLNKRVFLFFLLPLYTTAVFYKSYFYFDIFSQILQINFNLFFHFPMKSSLKEHNLQRPASKWVSKIPCQFRELQMKRTESCINYVLINTPSICDGELLYFHNGSLTTKNHLSLRKAMIYCHISQCHLRALPHFSAIIHQDHKSITIPFFLVSTVI